MKYVIYKDVTGLWRWRFVTNGRTIADSAEAYHNRQDAERGIEIMRNSGSAPTEGPQPKGLLDT